MTDDYPYDTGSYGRTVTTSSAEAQVWFDRGLSWMYAYHYEEAGECFDKALQHDPDCGMAYWGKAYTLGPNYNRPWEKFDEREMADLLVASRHAISDARAKMDGASDVEKAL